MCIFLFRNNGTDELAAMIIQNGKLSDALVFEDLLRGSLMFLGLPNGPFLNTTLFIEKSSI